MLYFNQKTGKFSRDGNHVAYGYSGHGEGKNNPALENESCVGPIPRGVWHVEVITANGVPCDYEGKKAPVMRLTPSPDTETFGRSGFLIHGDSVHEPGTASLGCIIENHDERAFIADAVMNLHDHTLCVD